MVPWLQQEGGAARTSVHSESKRQRLRLPSFVVRSKSGEVRTNVLPSLALVGLQRSFFRPPHVTASLARRAYVQRAQSEAQSRLSETLAPRTIGVWPRCTAPHLAQGASSFQRVVRATFGEAVAESQHADGLEVPAAASTEAAASSEVVLSQPDKSQWSGPLAFRRTSFSGGSRR